MSRRAPETLVDWLVEGIAPFLIMLLVGSLVFYLVEVFYLGDYQLRLLWVLGLFVMAIVCIARISMEEGSAYAALYAVPLAGAVALALAAFVQVTGPLAALGPALNWILMGIVWWSAHKLTWDCTLIEGGRDFTGQGLMQTTGLDRFFRVKPAADPVASKPEPTPPPPDLSGTSSTALAASANQPFWTTWLQGERRAHAPGVWVVYFSIAALPLFGLGQWFIPAGDLSLRRRAFWLLVVYVAAGLSLLMATSFLSLRRYLRQRNLQMPGEMAAVWLGTGTAIVFVLLLLASFLPRPIPEYSITHLAPEIKAPQRTASRWGWGREGAKSKPKAAHTATQGTASQHAQQPGDQGQPSGNTGKNQNSGSSGAAGSQPSSGSSSEKSSANQNQQSASNSQNSASGSPSSNQPMTDQQSQQQNHSQSGNSAEQPQNPSSNEPNSSDPISQLKENDPKGANQSSNNSQQPNHSGSTPRQNSNSNSSTKSKSASKSDSTAQQQQPQPADAQQTPPLPNEVQIQPQNYLAQAVGQVFAYLAHAFKWFFYLLVAAIIAYFAWKHREQLATAWQQLIKELLELWAKWFGSKRPSEVAAEPAAYVPPPKRFAEYADPFASGLAARWSLAELVRYTFEALEARGREQNCPRGSDQTPLEYAAAVGQVEPAFASEFRSLADLYGQLAFAGSAGSPQSRTLLQQLWQRWK